jgi:hypothetical protein
MENNELSDSLKVVRASILEAVVKYATRVTLKKLNIEKDLKNLSSVYQPVHSTQVDDMAVEDSQSWTVKGDDPSWFLRQNDVPAKLQKLLGAEQQEQLISRFNVQALNIARINLVEKRELLVQNLALEKLLSSVAQATERSAGWAILSEGARATLSASMTGEKFRSEVLNEVAAQVVKQFDADQVATPPTNPKSSASNDKEKKPSKALKVIGKVNIPKDIYNFLTLGFNFSLENAQAYQEKDEFTRIRIKTTFSPIKLSTFAITEINEVINFIANVTRLPRAIIADTAWELVREPDMITKIAQFPTREPYRKLLNFLLSKQVIIKQADKNAGIAIMPVKWYKKQVLDHLSNKKIYTEVREPNTAVLGNRLAAICKLHKVENIWQVDKIVPPFFYAMPKVHKTPISIRPIIPSHSWVTTSVAKWLHTKLYPIVQQMPWIITDRLQFVHKLESLRTTEKRFNLATLDVTSLYTNIDINDGIKRIQEYIIKYCSQPYLVIDLLKFVLQSNYFKFGEQWYKQIHGAAMGGNASCDFADLVLASLEEEAMVNEEFPSIYFRYRDDIFTGSTIQSLNKFQSTLNQMSVLKFNLEQVGNEVNFLDLTIYKDLAFKVEGKLQFKPFVKPTNARCHTHNDTYKPNNLKSNWIVGETIRILRGSSTAKAYRDELKQFKESLRKRGYCQGLIRAKCKYKFEDRNWLITKTEKTIGAIRWSRKICRNLHQRWNYSQDTLKPILDYYRITPTVRQENTLAVPINRAAKRVVMQVMTQQSAPKLSTTKTNQTAKCDDNPPLVINSLIRNATSIEPQGTILKRKTPCEPLQQEVARTRPKLVNPLTRSTVQTQIEVPYGPPNPWNNPFYRGWLSFEPPTHRRWEPGLKDDNT